MLSRDDGSCWGLQSFALSLLYLNEAIFSSQGKISKVEVTEDTLTDRGGLALYDSQKIPYAWHNTPSQRI
jgi:hypothetical protein